MTEQLEKTMATAL